MKWPRFRLTLFQIMALVAICAVLLSTIPPAIWLLVPAILIVIPGFTIDRARGGPGIVGAMVAGVVGFLGFGIAILTYLCLFRGLKVFDSPAPFVMTLALGIAGLAWGAVVGFWAWMILGLMGKGVRSGPVEGESIGPIVWHGLDEPDLRHSRAGGSLP